MRVQCQSHVSRTASVLLTFSPLMVRLQSESGHMSSEHESVCSGCMLLSMDATTHLFTFHLLSL